MCLLHLVSASFFSKAKEKVGYAYPKLCHCHSVHRRKNKIRNSSPWRRHSCQPRSVLRSSHSESFFCGAVLTVDTIEQSAEGLIVSLHATTSSVFCPRCGTAGSRVHSRYTRTVSDLTIVGQRLILKLLVRKWVCPLDSCPQRIFAEQFAGLARRYARMTDRLIQALQSAGVTTNGADGACLLSSLAMPTTAKTLIRRVLGLPLPKAGSIRIAGIDEWAWKKGSQYGTILVDLQQQRVAALLPERSVETSTAWFKKHPEVNTISRDRGKI